jgi:hypothetical protein
MAVRADQIVSGVKALHVLLSGAVAVLSATLIKERLIPEQIDVIGTVGALFISVSLLLTLAFWSRLQTLLPYFALASLITLSLLTFIQVRYVVTANVGPKDKEGKVPEQHFLIGYRLTDEGKKELDEKLGPNQSEKYYIESGGYTLIPVWYGSSYRVMTVAYTVAYMLFVMCVVLTMGGILRRGGELLVRNTAVNLSSSSPINPMHKQMKKIKILFLAANPEDTTQLRLYEEAREIDQALRMAEFRDKFDIEQHGAVRVRDLSGLLLRHSPDIVHFSGHGSEDSEIILEDDSGKSHPIPSAALSELFELLRDNIRCVVLNACYSEHQAIAIAEHIDCVVGMSEAIGDVAAISFAASFYQALGYGRNIETAFKLGCSQINMENLGEQNTPKLLAKRVDPKKVTLIN